MAIVCSLGSASHRTLNSQFGVKSLRSDASSPQDHYPAMGRVLRLYGGMDEAAKAARAARMKQMQDKPNTENESAKDERETYNTCQVYEPPEYPGDGNMTLSCLQFAHHSSQRQWSGIFVKKTDAICIA